MVTVSQVLSSNIRGWHLKSSSGLMSINSPARVVARWGVTVLMLMDVIQAPGLCNVLCVGLSILFTQSISNLFIAQQTWKVIVRFRTRGETTQVDTGWPRHSACGMNHWPKCFYSKLYPCKVLFWNSWEIGNFFLLLVFLSRVGSEIQQVGKGVGKYQ